LPKNNVVQIQFISISELVGFTDNQVTMQ